MRDNVSSGALSRRSRVRSILTRLVCVVSLVCVGISLRLQTICVWYEGAWEANCWSREIIVERLDFGLWPFFRPLFDLLVVGSLASVSIPAIPGLFGLVRPTRSLVTVALAALGVTGMAIFLLLEAAKAMYSIGGPPGASMEAGAYYSLAACALAAVGGLIAEPAVSSPSEQQWP
jgi:hypothetical protein